MSAPQPHYEIFALRYAHAADRTQGSNLIFPDDHAAPMPLDFFLWVVRGNGRTIVFDTGFDAASAERRGRTWLRSPIEALAGIGVDAADVRDVVLSHMHWDHAGHWHEFPKARFHLQDEEMTYCTGRCMCHEPMRRPFDIEQVTTAVRFVFAERVKFHAGTAELAPGVTVHLVGGHSGGLQIMRVPTARGWVVLASDATHFYANMERGLPFPIVADVPAVLEGYATLRRLASSPAHVIPGHDPLVLDRYPAAAPGLEGIAVRLDADPIGSRLM